MNITYVWKKFDELTLDELYLIINLRQEVFIVEQNCPYMDADHSDQDAFHLLGLSENKLVAYLRVFKPNIKYSGSSMGRIVVKETERNQKIGKKITEIGINFLKEKYPNEEIVISAQNRLRSFYEDIGFTARGEIYLEDDIDHIQMFI